jgi:hypothetical protein
VHTVEVENPEHALGELGLRDAEELVKRSN